VYVLTSRATFSAAEGFAYGLQALGRAVIVGDTTGGGAHAGGLHRVTDHFGVWVPGARAVNPITQRNWEGIGVRPDVAAPEGEALGVAHALALRQLLAQEPDAERRRRLERAIAQVEQR
jgi:C-terminal processing protease CtpA/Prc